MVIHRVSFSHSAHIFQTKHLDFLEYSCASSNNSSSLKGFCLFSVSSLDCSVSCYWYIHTDWATYLDLRLNCQVIAFFSIFAWKLQVFIVFSNHYSFHDEVTLWNLWIWWSNFVNFVKLMKFVKLLKKSCTNLVENDMIEKYDPVTSWYLNNRSTASVEAGQNEHLFSTFDIVAKSDIKDFIWWHLSLHKVILVSKCKGVKKSTVFTTKLN